jgi:hypothetical protein
LTTICWLWPQQDKSRGGDWCCGRGGNQHRRCCKGGGSGQLERKVHYKGGEKVF